jgi:perosamine synthetase
MTGGELELVRQVIDSNYLNDGDVTERFERAVADRVGSKHAVAVTSGTTAITLALMAAGVRAGDEVVVPDMTFIATANAVRLAGGTPVLADVDERAITPRTRAVVPVHVSGRAADMAAIARVAKDHDVAVVEDAAEAFISRVDARALGTIGVAGCLSFSPNKSITTGQGGIVLTDDDDLAGRVRSLKDQGRPVRGTGGDDVHPTVGFNFKFTNLQAAIGLAQLRVLDERLERQRRTYGIYAKALADVPGIRLPGFDLARGETPLWTDAVVDRRDDLDRWLSDRAMGCRRFWFPIHTQAPYRRDDADFPVSTRVAPKAMWLPSAFTITDEDVATVCESIVSFLKT